MLSKCKGKHAGKIPSSHERIQGLPQHELSSASLYQCKQITRDSQVECTLAVGSAKIACFEDVFSFLSQYTKDDDQVFCVWSGGDEATPHYSLLMYVY